MIHRRTGPPVHPGGPSEEEGVLPALHQCMHELHTAALPVAVLNCAMRPEPNASHSPACNWRQQVPTGFPSPWCVTVTKPTAWLRCAACTPCRQNWWSESSPVGCLLRKLPHHDRQAALLRRSLHCNVRSSGRPPSSWKHVQGGAGGPWRLRLLEQAQRQAALQAAAACCAG